MDEVIISRAITESFMKEFMESMEVDVAVVGAGPSGLLAAHCLAKSGLKTAVFERQLRVGGGMPGGGMMFNRVVLQKEGKDILDEFGVRTKLYKRGYYTADALEAISSLCVGAIRSGAKIFNLVTVEDLMIRGDKRVSGLVLQWTAVNMAKMHVDPLTVRAKVVIDATGHESDVCHILVRKTGPKLKTATGGIVGEKSMWAERGEADLVKNTIEVYPGLIVAGMAANAVLGSPRMGAIFGGMLISGKRAAELARTIVKKG
ncbi:MAG: thiazole biosynthesis protein [Dehalococcoidia bacterium]|nr:thiazole biosynthesis protein [Dehalococcoidia bacterium]